MFDNAKLVRLMKDHPRGPLTQSAVALGTEINQTTIRTLILKEGVDPSLDTLERLAKFFYGDHRRIDEFSDQRPPADRRAELVAATARRGSVTMAKKKTPRR